MKKFLILIFVFYKSLLGGSCYIPCNAYASQKSTEKQQDINQAYNTLDDKLENVEDKYKEYLKSLEKQNELLEKITKVRKLNSLKMKEINFILSKIIEDKSIKIDVETSKALKIFLDNNLKNIKEIK
ncbi:hypothetical protein CRU99_13100 [Malaciobacter mytili]|uniref:hypothetical protein n=1 Tax=Malaciobacter mytili TaxID=603050 RepID=UPI00100A6297|nr:hypothetical protein [Malaciobacter mytili]RXI36938.1 hypothetical protein CRU99_13100 [Malaciobacter mytili]